MRNEAEESDWSVQFRNVSGEARYAKQWRCTCRWDGHIGPAVCGEHRIVAQQVGEGCNVVGTLRVSERSACQDQQTKH